MKRCVEREGDTCRDIRQRLIDMSAYVAAPEESKPFFIIIDRLMDTNYIDEKIFFSPFHEDIFSIVFKHIKKTH